MALVAASKQGKQEVVERVEREAIHEVRRDPESIWSAKKMAKGAVNVFLVPWSFAMNDDYFNSIHMDPRLRRVREEYQTEKKKNKANGIQKRVRTNAFIKCVGGCGQAVAVSYPTYDPVDSNYLICKEDCADPIAAHKECVRNSMAETGQPRFNCPCETCDGQILMTGKFRLGFWELPYTFLALMRGILRHLVFMPMIFCYVVYGILWLQAVMDYDKGELDQFPSNPFTFRYVLYSESDPNFAWEAQTLRQKWFQGFVGYCLFMFWWWILLGRIWGFCAKRFNRLLWRYDL